MAGNLLGGSPTGIVQVRVGSGLSLEAGVLSVEDDFGSLGTIAANLIYAGPASGVDADPTFRAMVSADLPDTAVTPGSYTYASLTVDAKGRLTAASSGVAPALGANPTAQVSGVAVNGVATTFMRSDAAPRLADTAVTPGSYVSADITVDAQGRITAAATGAAASAITALTGDVTATGPGSVAATLATVNANVGSFGSSTSIPSFTVNAKGLITAASGNAVVAPAGTLTGATLAAGVTASSLTSVGTIGTGVWQGTRVGVTYGGTGANLSATGGAGQVLKQASAGAAVTVGAVGVADLSGLGTGIATALAINVGSAGAPVLFNGALGTPSSGTLTNATGLPISTGVSGLGADVATFLATPSSANLAAAVTGETGSGALVFGTNPTFTTAIQITNNAGNAGIQMGRYDGTASTPYFDWNSGATAVDYDVRLLASGGTGSVGGGLLTVIGTLGLAVGHALAFKAGTDARAGNATLVAGTVTVSNTTVTANTIVALTRKTSGGTIGTAITYTLSAGASFTITSDSVLDTSTFSYVLFELN